MNRLIIGLITSSLPFFLNAQVGLIQKSEGVYDGLTLLHPSGSTDTHLIDNDGTLLHIWPGDLRPGNAVYLLENGLLLRAQRTEDEFIGAGGRGGRLQLVEWDGTINWQYDIASPTEKQHHDMEILPNGNILVIAWEYFSAEEAVANGRDPVLLTESLWPDKIIELKPLPNNEAEIVWEWHAWDHLIQDFDMTKENFGVVSENPGKININSVLDANEDWIHFNSISYNEELDQILLSSGHLSEIWIIDHSTTTEEARTSSGGNSGQGGELLYRWGNPQMYSRGTESDQKLFRQHDAKWLEEDGKWKVLLFNNGVNRPEGFLSSVETLELPIDQDGNYAISQTAPFGPLGPDWVYTDPDDPTSFYSAFVSGAQRLQNGNTIICSGVVGDIFEINTSNEVVWRFIAPVSAGGDLICPNDEEALPGFVFRAEKYPRDYAGLQELSDFGEWGREVCPLNVTEPEQQLVSCAHFTNSIQISSHHIINEIIVQDMNGKIIQRSQPEEYSTTISKHHFVPGIYILNTILEGGSTDKSKILVR